MSLYNRSSLIQVPSLYKDGTLVSTIPEDRSGDFTVARGSNLAATRVGEDGYIKKGYENLIKYSNNFDIASTDWVSLGNASGGQAGYDGTNDAWNFTSVNTSSPLIQNNSQGGVQTLSAYFKKNANFGVQFFSFGSVNPRANFNLNAGNVVSSFNTIDAKIEPIGTDWFRCSMTFNQTNTSVRFYITNNVESSVVGTITIQDAQLNQGLVAYPYLETTTAPAQGGLLENTPRVDWSNGVPAVKLEEQRTNLIDSSEWIGSWGVNNISVSIDDTISPEGYANVSKLTAPSTGLTRAYQLLTFIAGTTYTFSAWIKNINATAITFVWFDAVNQIFIDLVNNVNTESFTRVSISFTPTNTYSSSQVQVGRNLPTGESFYIYGAQLEEATTPSSYIPTYGTTQTRSNEVISDNFDIPTTATIYNSFYSDIAETVFVLDQVFNVAEGLNKVAIAFSPTAVKISVGGSIVANATGTYDTTALSNIQLGSNNGTDYSNAPISGFYVFPEFLTDEELNSLTD